MKHLLKALVLGGVVAGFSVAAPTTASAQYVAPPVVPDDGYIAVAEPVYWNGVPHYWYQNHWYYRNGGAWAWYQAEPAYLHDYRFHHWAGGVYRPDYRYHHWHR